MSEKLKPDVSVVRAILSRPIMRREDMPTVLAVMFAYCEQQAILTEANDALRMAKDALEKESQLITELASDVIAQAEHNYTPLLREKYEHQRNRYNRDIDAAKRGLAFVAAIKQMEGV